MNKEDFTIRTMPTHYSKPIKFSCRTVELRYRDITLFSQAVLNKNLSYDTIIGKFNEFISSHHKSKINLEFISFIDAGFEKVSPNIELKSLIPTLAENLSPGDFITIKKDRWGELSVTADTSFSAKQNMQKNNLTNRGTIIW